MSDSSPPRQEDKVNTFAVIMVGAVSTLLVWASIVLLQAYYANTAGPVERERNAAGQSKEMRDLRAAQITALSEARYVPGKDGKRFATLPIDVAMKKVLADAEAGKATLVPAVGLHDAPTVPAAPGRPPDAMPAAEQKPAAETSDPKGPPPGGAE